MYYEAYIDGAITFNPGGYGSWGFVVYCNEEEVVAKSGYLGFGSTNNIAEFEALLAGLDWMLNHLNKGDRWVIYSDSMLVVKLMNFDWKAHKLHISNYVNRASEDIKLLTNQTSKPYSERIIWIPREENARADELSHQVFEEAY